MNNPLLPGKIDGMTVYDWKRRVEIRNASALVGALGDIRRNTTAGWVVIAPMWLTPNISSTEVAPHPSWTLSDSTVVAMAAKAHALGMKVMMKLHVKLGCSPQIGSHSPACVGDCQTWGTQPNQPCGRDNIGINHGGVYGGPFDTAQWDAWFESYSAMVMHYAKLVQSEGMDGYCVATELTGAYVGDASTNTTAVVAEHWRALLGQTRQAVGSRANGKAVLLTVAMHEWDLEKGASFMDAPDLDMIGFDVYRTFSELKGVTTPTADQFSRAFFTRGEFTNRHHVAQQCVSPFEWYANVSAFYGKPVVFTEWGFKSTDSCGSAGAGSIAAGSGSTADNGACQANGFTGTQELLGRAAWWGGGFWWDWTAAGFQGSSLGADGKLQLQGGMRAAWSVAGANRTER
jgi:hypothetical protein